MMNRYRLAHATAMFAAAASLLACQALAPLSGPGPASAPAASSAPPSVVATPPATTPPAPSPVAAPAPAPPAPVPVRPYEEAVLAATQQLFAAAPAPTAPTPLLIDPLIDGMTGAQSRATQDLGARITELVKSRYPAYQVQPFSAANVQRAPVVLIGTFTGVNAQRQTTGKREDYRICLALIDLKTGRILSKGLAFSEPKGVDITPLPFFQDAPAFTDDPATIGYIRTCQGTKGGEPINPAYLDRVVAAAQLSEGIEAYHARRYADALALYEAAARTPAGDQLRAYNGIYLANLRLGRRTEANHAFAQLVRYSLANKRLAVKFLFRPGTVAFVADPAVSGPYPTWIQQIAAQTMAASACLEIVGHTSATGPAALNDRLSLLRAEEIRRRLEAETPALAQRTLAIGKGSSETLVGNARDDASDALDRRVEFKVIQC